MKTYSIYIQDKNREEVLLIQGIENLETAKAYLKELNSNLNRYYTAFNEFTNISEVENDSIFDQYLGHYGFQNQLFHFVDPVLKNKAFIK